MEIPIPPDPYDEFMNSPVTNPESSDPRFRVKRIPEAEFERAWALVDAAFGKVRPREQYEWMYRQNPYGRARLWGMEEVATGKLIKTGGGFPWPVWKGSEVLRGGLSGDAGTSPEWQRKGLSRIRRAVTSSHAFRDGVCQIAWPNEGSQAVMRDAGKGGDILGMVTGGVIPLNAGPMLRSRMPQWLADIAGQSLQLPFRLLQRASLPATTPDTLRAEPLDRFDARFDTVTLNTMHFDGFWCPHNHVLLNWRYLQHPVERYQALAVYRADTPVAYAVLRLDQHKCTLSEFAAPVGEPEVCKTLMALCLQIARDADAAYMAFFATPNFRHWPLFRRAGMLRFTTKNCLEAAWRDHPEGVAEMDNWQILPGDRDYH